jgi:hypothetical protein
VEWWELVFKNSKRDFKILPRKTYHDEYVLGIPTQAACSLYCIHPASEKHLIFYVVSQRQPKRKSPLGPRQIRSDNINYGKFEELTLRDVVYETKMKHDLTHEVLVGGMDMAQ